MFWMPVFLVSAGIMLWRVDWSQLDRLLPVMMAGLLCGGIPAALPLAEPVFVCTDTGLLSQHWAIVLAGQIVFVPLISAWFASGIRPCDPLPQTRVLLFSLATTGMFIAAERLNRITFAPWHPPHYIFLFFLLFYSFLFQVHRYFSACGSPRRFWG